MSEFIDELDDIQEEKTPKRVSDDTSSQSKGLQNKIAELERALAKISGQSKQIKKITVSSNKDGTRKASVKTNGSTTTFTGNSISKATKKFSNGHSNTPKPDKRNATQIISISYPIKYQGSNSRCCAKYQVDIDYIGSDGKKHHKVVNFGNVNKLDFIDTKDEKARLIRVNSAKKDLNILYPQFWNYLFLNHHSGDLKQAFADILKIVNLA